MNKLDRLVGDEWVPYVVPSVFSRAHLKNGSERLEIGVPNGDAQLLERLAAELQPPYYLLYVLHTPRGEGEAGRYQSPAVEPHQLQAFLARFRVLLASDSRFDLWLHSPADGATLVWDRHDLMYAYGDLEGLAKVLVGMGFVEGSAQPDFDHSHHYRPEMDADASALLNYFDWHHSPLQPADEQ